MDSDGMHEEQMEGEYYVEGEHFAEGEYDMEDMEGMGEYDMEDIEAMQHYADMEGYDGAHGYEGNSLFYFYSFNHAVA